ncbi:ankyrin repeat domain-containing protein 39 isoform X1 [Danio rerio]|uniref:Ankyrin repeat domain 39 n=2 Tax=Danio rerio TaxID=7955 RepID=A9C3P2_DANRE|nr:ankyrin repeat domain-containing protein 39 [Danio rerio]XP_005167388.1 ankyrin repeat domain-containing protein 39 isoform X1 [Danio rerio]|eukprot:NP_001107112.1 ankyrin repeat domain-containing protein 39 [Danio rerio]
MNPHGGQCTCSGHLPTPSVHQTLEEMDFERGIWSAAMDGDVERVRMLIKKGTDPNMRDQANYTALHYASRAGHVSVCELLLDCGACVNAQTHGGATPLHRAAYCGHQRVLKLLLERGADPGLTDDDGATPLHKAAEQRCFVVCKLLVKRFPALRDIKDKRSRIPFDLCPEDDSKWEFLKPAQ